MAGFIHGKLDIKLLILYILSHAAAPLDFPTLTDLAMCDPGVDYFLFAEAAAELVDSGHVSAEGGCYAATEKGRRNSADSGSSLSPVVRQRCDRRLEALNARLRRDGQVRAQVEPAGEGEFILRLWLDDERGNLLTLSLLTASEEECSRMAERFRARPEKVYHAILSAVLGGGEERADV